MNENTRKKFNIEIQICNYLMDLKNYAEGAYNYIIGNPIVTDEEEILACLESVPDIAEIIDNLIQELEVLYENDQLQ